MDIKVMGLGNQIVSHTNDVEDTVNSALKTAIDTISRTTLKENTNAEIPETNSKTISKTVEEIQKFCDMCGRKLQFKINDDTKKIVVKVIDTSTDKVVREIPSEEIQKLQARIRETIGLLFDETI